MAVKITIDGKQQINATGYSVQEDSTPINPADETGGTSQIDFSVPKYSGWKASRLKGLELRDDTQGKTQGKVTSLSESGGIVSFTASSRILNLSVERKAQPFVGNLRDAIRYYVSLVGITEGVVIEEGLELIQVAFPGWIDNVYQKIARGLCPAWGIEMSLVSNNIVFRSLRGRKAILRRLTAAPVQNIDDGDLAQGTSTTWYDTNYVVDTLVYPDGGWNPDVEVLDVNSGEFKVWENIELETSLFSIKQPECRTGIGPNFKTASVYTVSGADGLPIPPDMWRDYGGDLRVEINDDTRSLKVTVVGMNFPEYAPYTIGIASGPSTYYSTLRLIGTGVQLGTTEMLHGTGLDEDYAPEELADSVDNTFIISLPQAHDASAWQVAAARGPKHSLSFSASGINRVSNTGSYSFATFADFDAEYAGKTFADLDAIWAGKTTDDWDEFWTARTATDFANQAFGNIAGARIYWDDCIYRIRSATNDNGKISGTAEADMTVADFDEFYEGMTIADFDRMWAGKTMEEFDTGPFPGIK